MATEWTDVLAINIEEIDSQHKELFRQANQLLEASLKGAGKEELERTLQFLGNYVVEHFGTEERYMEAFNYPWLAAHKKEHADFAAYFEQTRIKVAREGVALTTLLQVQSRIVDWLHNHIRKSDKVLGIYLQTKMPSAK